MFLSDRKDQNIFIIERLAMPSVRSIYKCVILSLILLQLVWFFLPWDFAYRNGANGALFWLGANAFIESPEVISAYSNVVTIIYLITYLGLFFCIAVFRPLFLVLVVIGGLTIPLFGLSVASGYESMLGYFMTLGDGLILCMIYFTEVSRSFAKKYQ